ncbi:hypothetical protein A2154_01160 [Candidatus Gottesmanbacteria bacterium RBG_16_43_7]|uniref:Fido domain-containing protein n=1 Tax=Candidatus Gottesmanbacteria bacterium RBG_16_43_7 TaxID=1798373 RepID=A0A1F5ZAA9_9BACT|nr:MAG: hypothetical protein A2154_01160 [Candidatus Gottesmanbacteria bacterium RBG_16_43_7]
MKFPPIYQLTPEINQLLIDLEALKRVVGLLNPAPQVIEYLKRKSILKSSVFSARIEGNPLMPEDIREINMEKPITRNAQEVSNLLSAYTALESYRHKPTDVDTVRALHRYVMAGLEPTPGQLRMVDSAVYNRAGLAVYIAPAHWKVRQLLSAMCEFINSAADPRPAVAAVTHIWFEKIHPFEDGNGRVGRLLSALILKSGGYDLGGLVPFEEYLDNNRQAYYDALTSDSQDVTVFISFFIRSITAQSHDSLEKLKNPPPDKYLNLLPRRAEILAIIEDHRQVSFDFISRRFRQIPQRTIHYDITRLIRDGLVRKRGSTRGALYEPDS